MSCERKTSVTLTRPLTRSLRSRAPTRRGGGCGSPVTIAIGERAERSSTGGARRSTAARGAARRVDSSSMQSIQSTAACPSG
eukprot:2049097-Prymnesium_polylepis.1